MQNKALIYFQAYRALWGPVLWWSKDDEADRAVSWISPDSRPSVELHKPGNYGIEIIAVLKGDYIGSTDIHVYHKSEPHKGWTGGLGVLKKFRRSWFSTFYISSKIMQYSKHNTIQ